MTVRVRTHLTDRINILVRITSKEHREADAYHPEFRRRGEFTVTICKCFKSLNGYGHPIPDISPKKSGEDLN
jgi:hypothetical protein